MPSSLDEAMFAERPIKIFCIGAGVSGLCFAYKISRSFSNFSLTIYEKNQEVSGTCCACDVPAHNYTYTFEPKHDWSSVYATSAEIKQYYLDFCDKYNLGQYIKTSQKVISCCWQGTGGKWLVRVQDMITKESYESTCDLLINAGGFLNNWSWPEIKGLKDFAGPIVHSANWDKKIVFEGKAVGLVGNGPSAVQILPALQPVAENVITFFRSPSWIIPSIGAAQREYTSEEQREFLENPKTLTTLRKKTEASLNGSFEVYLRDTLMQRETREKLIDFMKTKLHRRTIEEALIPTFGVCCRRMTPGPNYLEALTKSNVHVVSSRIEKITSKGCKCQDESEYDLDVIDEWSSEPSAYMGIAAARFPDMFFLFGPYSPIGNGPLHPCIEARVDHILKLIDRYQTEPIHSIAPKFAAVSDFMAHTANFMKGTVWSEPCSSTYKNHARQGRMPVLWPGSSLHCLEALADVRGDDWEIVYNGNRFAWLGNGMGSTDLDLTSDLAYYIGEKDDSPFLSRRKRRGVLTGSGTQPERRLHQAYRP